MSLIRLNTTPSRRDLCVFGILWLACFGFLGALAWHRGAHRAAVALWITGGAVAGPGLVVPAALRYVYLTAIYATFPVGLAVSFVILAAVYYLVLTPVGLMMRLLGNDPLTRRPQPGQKTYWSPRDGSRPARSYLRQH